MASPRAICRPDSFLLPGNFQLVHSHNGVQVYKAIIDGWEHTNILGGACDVAFLVDVLSSSSRPGGYIWINHHDLGNGDVLVKGIMSVESD